MYKHRYSIFALLLAVAPSIASAHTGSTAHNLMGGFAHPLTGLDHILAMVGVGLVAAYLGGKARYMLPGAFLSMMIVGGIVASFGVVVPFVEAMILASIFVIGGMLALGFRMPSSIAALSVGFFAFFHGYAHIVEVGSHSALLYGAGFLVATALLHGLGLIAGIRAFRLEANAARFAGAATVTAGILLAFGIL